MMSGFFLFGILIVGAILIIKWVVIVALIVLINEAFFLSFRNGIWVEKIHVFFDFGEKEASIQVVKNSYMGTDITEDFLSFFEEDKILVFLFRILNGLDEREMSMEVFKLFFDLLLVWCCHVVKRKKFNLYFMIWLSWSRLFQSNLTFENEI